MPEAARGPGEGLARGPGRLEEDGGVAWKRGKKPLKEEEEMETVEG